MAAVGGHREPVRLVDFAATPVDADSPDCCAISGIQDMHFVREARADVQAGCVFRGDVPGAPARRKQEDPGHHQRSQGPMGSVVLPHADRRGRGIAQKLGCNTRRPVSMSDT